MTVPSIGPADYTKGPRTRLNGAQTLQTGRDVIPADRSLVERGLDVRMDLEHDR